MTIQWMLLCMAFLSACAARSTPAPTSSPLVTTAQYQDNTPALIEADKRPEAAAFQEKLERAERGGAKA